MTIRIGINGIGRIGRLVYRIAANTPGVEVVAVNDLVPADNLAYLLKYDTMHGRFKIDGKHAELSATETSFTVNGHTTQTKAERDPANLPWGDWGVDYVLGLQKNVRLLQRGVKFVENAANLGQLAMANPDGCTLVVGAPKHVRGTGGPSRRPVAAERPDSPWISMSCPGRDRYGPLSP